MLTYALISQSQLVRLIRYGLLNLLHSRRLF